MLHVAQAFQVPDNKTKQRLEASGIRHWIYLGEDSTWRIQAEYVLAPDIGRISIADLLENISQELRRPYIEWIGTLSLRNDSLEWWSSELAAKNPYHRLYIRICLLAAGRNLLLSGLLKDTIIICSSSALTQEIQRYAMELDIPLSTHNLKKTLPDKESLKSRMITCAGQILKVSPQVPAVGRYLSLYQNYLEKDLRYRRHILKQGKQESINDFTGERTVLLFTWVDKRNFTPDGRYTDPYFGPLPGLLKQRGYRVAFVPRVLFTLPFSEAVKRLDYTQETIFFPEEFLLLEDIRSCRKRMACYCPDVPDPATVKGIPVRALALENFSETLPLLAENLTYGPLINAMRTRGICPERIIHTCEGHSWEQALSWSVHQYMNGTKVIGYDNVTFSRLVLSMYPAGNEYGRRPLPDRIITNGPLYRDVLLKEGMPETRVSTGCALRHTYLWNHDKSGNDGTGLRQAGKPWKILVATAIGLGDSVELVAKACDAFGGDENYEVLVKCHPLVRPDNVRHFLGEKARFPNVFFDDRPVSALLPKSHILLYTYTSVCFEAMIHGVIPVCVRAENFLNLDKLDAVPDIRWCVTTPMELQKVAKEIQSMPADTRASWQERAYRIVQEALAPPSEECIDAFLA
jgi:hypothetical protein